MTKSFRVGNESKRPREEKTGYLRLKRFRGNLKGAGTLSERSRQMRRATGGSGYRILSARADLTAALACRAPKTMTEAIVALASSGVTSWAMVASPSTLM
jgi:hypothetical protein